MQKRANRANQLVLFFLAGANFWEKHAKNRRKQAKTRKNRRKTGAFLVLMFLGGKLVGANFYAFCNYVGDVKEQPLYDIGQHSWHHLWSNSVAMPDEPLWHIGINIIHWHLHQFSRTSEGYHNKNCVLTLASHILKNYKNKYEDHELHHNFYIGTGNWMSVRPRQLGQRNPNEGKRWAWFDIRWKWGLQDFNQRQIEFKTTLWNFQEFLNCWSNIRIIKNFVGILPPGHGSYDED